MTVDAARRWTGILSTGLPPDALGDAKRAVIRRLPAGVKRGLAGPYNRIQMVKADRAFRRRSPPERTPSPEAPRHVVCITVDALRADAVTPDVSPFLAERCLGAAVTPAPWTFPAVSSLLTGRYPHEHGAVRQSDEADRGATELVVPPRLADESETLPEAFASAGYRTYGAFAFHMPFFALSGRFERHALYDDADAATVLGEFETWIRQRRDERTFSYVHLGDLHEPVDPPERYWRAHDVDASIPSIRRWAYADDPAPGADGERYREHRRRLYRAALDYTDDRLRRLVDRLREELGDDVAVLVTGDHGEAFWEHAAFDESRFVDSRPAYCIDHGGTPYESIARVPLAVDGLDLPPFDSVNAPASLVDVAPTLLEALGAPDALATSGRSLVDGPPADRPVFVESTRYGYERKAAYLDGWKLLVSERDGVAVGFDLPAEEPADLPADIERRLSEALPSWPDGHSPDVCVSGIAQQRLEDLGYV